ncbi:MAG: hypothetical protein SXQ77_03480, partial [Halobacteria archaeon]|nr:hypothetical protein [Halobacteria archaeon]
FYSVDDFGITESFQPSSEKENIARIRRNLKSLSVTSGSEDSELPPTPIETGPEKARRTRDRLSNSRDSSFEEKLLPIFSETTSYVDRLEDNQLFSTIRNHVSKIDENKTVVLFTNDSNKQELREIVKLARRRGDSIAMFITPNSLFQAHNIDDAEDAYDSYREFEEFRRNLSGMNRVSVFEVGSRDRVEWILRMANSRTKTGGNTRL